MILHDESIFSLLTSLWFDSERFLNIALDSASTNTIGKYFRKMQEYDRAHIEGQQAGRRVEQVVKQVKQGSWFLVTLNDFHSSVFDMLNMIIAFPLMILLWLVLSFSYVKFENRMIFHYAHVCLFMIVTSEATTAQLIKHLKKTTDDSVNCITECLWWLEKIPQIHEKGLQYYRGSDGSELSNVLPR